MVAIRFSISPGAARSSPYKPLGFGGASAPLRAGEAVQAAHHLRTAHLITRSATEPCPATAETAAPADADSSTHTGTNRDGTVAAATTTTAAADGPELDFVHRTAFQQALTSFRLAFALPWRRFKDGSALTFKLGGAIAEKPQPRFSPDPSLPAICDCLLKAAYDPRVVGIVFKIDPLAVGWAKIIEIRRHVELFRKSGKFAVAYLERAGEKEYFLASAFGEIYAPPSASLSLRGLAVSGTFLRGVLDKVGVTPELRRIGKYKSAGDQLLRTDMSEPQREQLSALLEDIYEEFVAAAAAGRGKSAAQFEALLEEGVFDMARFKEGGWVDGLLYEDELNEVIKGRTGGDDKELRVVGYKRYAGVGRGVFGLGGGLGAKSIAVVRTSGAITAGGGGAAPSGITSGAVVAELGRLEKDKSVAAVVLRVDSPGGDALASDLMWRAIQQLSKEKPVVASMADVAASGGYYMAMACRKIVAEALTITGSVGVIAGKFSLGELYSKVGYSKEIISRGRYAQLLADNRAFTEDEAALFDAAAEHAYTSFRDKAAASRGLEVEAMQEVAQGRVWSGKRAATVGLVDSVGGVNRAIQLAKEAAGIAADQGIHIREVSRGSFSPLALLAGGGALAAAGRLLLQLALGGVAGGDPAAALGAPVLMQALAAAASGSGGGASGGLSAADQSLVQALAAGGVVAQMPELCVDGVASQALLRGGPLEGGGGSELFDC